MYVLKIDSDSPASEVDIEPYDLITHVNDIEFPAEIVSEKISESIRKKEEVKITFQRDNDFRMFITARNRNAAQQELTNSLEELRKIANREDALEKLEELTEMQTMGPSLRRIVQQQINELRVERRRNERKQPQSPQSLPPLPYNNLTIQELKQGLKDLGVSFENIFEKGDLQRMLRDAEIEAAQKKSREGAQRAAAGEKLRMEAEKLKLEVERRQKLQAEQQQRLEAERIRRTLQAEAENRVRERVAGLRTAFPSSQVNVPTDNDYRTKLQTIKQLYKKTVDSTRVNGISVFNNVNTRDKWCKIGGENVKNLRQLLFLTYPERNEYEDIPGAQEEIHKFWIKTNDIKHQCDSAKFNKEDPLYS